MAPPPSRFWGRAGRLRRPARPQTPRGPKLWREHYSVFLGVDGVAFGDPVHPPNIFLPSLRPKGPQGGGIHIKKEARAGTAS